MLRKMVIDVFSQTWPMLVICSVIFISFRLVYIFKNKQQFIVHREILMYLFGIYIMCLFYVVTAQDVVSFGSNFTPFQEMFRYTFGSNLFIKNVIGNVVMFLPYGFFLGYFLKIKKIRYIFLLSSIVSLTIETIQGHIGRVFDIDDVILNILGSVVGFIIYLLFSKIKDKLPSFLKNTLFYSIIILAIVTVFILYLFNIIEVYNV